MLSKFLKDVKYPLKDITIVSPDYGGVKRARMVASKMSVPIAIVDKRRPKPNEVEIENILGDVKNKHCILPDDMIDTGGTMLSVAKLLKSKGAKSVSIIATHGLFNGKSIENFDQAFKDKIIMICFFILCDQLCAVSLCHWLTSVLSALCVFFCMIDYITDSRKIK